jgi:hypothetical protein
MGIAVMNYMGSAANLDVLHDIEGRPQDRDIGAEAQHSRDGDCCISQRRLHAVLTLHCMR